MIYELRTYTLRPGTVQEYLRYNAEIGRPVRGDRYGKLVGAWTTDIGPLNQYVHLWEYESAAERERLRGELANDRRWATEYVPKIRPFMLAQDNILLNLDEEIGLRPVTGGGHVYELRTYKVQVGQYGAWSAAFKKALPAREQYSKIVGLWSGEAGTLNLACHIWVYDDLNQRTWARAAALKDPVWGAFAPVGPTHLVEMHSTILVPTGPSPLQ